LDLAATGVELTNQGSSAENKDRWKCTRVTVIRNENEKKMH